MIMTCDNARYGDRRGGMRVQSRDQIYVTGLPNYLSLSSLEHLFEQYGFIKKSDNRGYKLITPFKDRKGHFTGAVTIMAP